MFWKIYLISLISFFAIDLVWLSVVAKQFYAKYLGYLMGSTVRWIPALLFYFLFIVGIVVFVITPALEQHSWSQALLRGLLFGLITYATYDLTNLSTIKDWPLIVTIVDLFWGSFIAGFVSTITVLIVQKFGL